MAHKFLLCATPKTLETKILVAALAFKGVLYEQTPNLGDGPPAFFDAGDRIKNSVQILAHLDERFPAPPFMPGDVQVRSRIRMIMWDLLAAVQASPYNLGTLLDDFEPFIGNDKSFLLGDTPTIIDAAIAAICPKDARHWSEFYDRMNMFYRKQMGTA